MVRKSPGGAKGKREGLAGIEYAVKARPVVGRHGMPGLTLVRPRHHRAFLNGQYLG